MPFNGEISRALFWGSITGLTVVVPYELLEGSFPYRDKLTDVALITTVAVAAAAPLGVG